MDFGSVTGRVLFRNASPPSASDGLQFNPSSSQPSCSCCSLASHSLSVDTFTPAHRRFFWSNRFDPAASDAGDCLSLSPETSFNVATDASFFSQFAPLILPSPACPQCRPQIAGSPQFSSFPAASFPASSEPSDGSSRRVQVKSILPETKKLESQTERFESDSHATPQGEKGEEPMIPADRPRNPNKRERRQRSNPASKRATSQHPADSGSSSSSSSSCSSSSSSSDSDSNSDSRPKPKRAKQNASSRAKPRFPKPLAVKQFKGVRLIVSESCEYYAALIDLSRLVLGGSAPAKRRGSSTDSSGSNASKSKSNCYGPFRSLATHAFPSVIQLARKDSNAQLSNGVQHFDLSDYPAFGSVVVPSSDPEVEQTQRHPKPDKARKIGNWGMNRALAVSRLSLESWISKQETKAKQLKIKMKHEETEKAEEATGKSKLKQKTRRIARPREKETENVIELVESAEFERVKSIAQELKQWETEQQTMANPKSRIIVVKTVNIEQLNQSNESIPMSSTLIGRSKSSDSGSDLLCTEELCSL